MSLEYTTRETRICRETCGWEGDVDVTAYIDEDWSGVTWTCPRCGYEHETDSRR